MKARFAIGAALAMVGAAATLVAGQLPRYQVPQAAYNGRVEFTWIVKGPAGSSSVSWIAAVGAGKASCSGSSQIVSQDGQTTRADLGGSGLFTLRFEGAKYSFDIACPSAEHQREADWSDQETSFKQAGSEGKDLKGSWSEPSDDDPANGVTGSKTMTWSLCYKKTKC